MKYYAVSYLDSDGYVHSYGYAASMDQYKSGDILKGYGGQWDIRIDFQYSQKPII